MSNNAIWNVKNPFQTDAKRVLCVCSAGLLRSPTAANVLHREYGYNTRAAGIEEEYALIFVTDLLLHWAQEIVAMEEWQAKRLMARLNNLQLDKPIIVLDTPDKYEWNHSELQTYIKTAYAAKRT